MRRDGHGAREEEAARFSLLARRGASPQFIACAKRRLPRGWWAGSRLITGRRSARFRRRRRNRPFGGAPHRAHRQSDGRPGSHPSSAALLGVEPGPPCTGVMRLPPARRKASSGWNPHAASLPGGLPLRDMACPPKAAGTAREDARWPRRMPASRSATPDRAPCCCERVPTRVRLRLGCGRALLRHSDGVAERVAPSARTPTAPQTSRRTAR